jgi:hypothetical protein
MKVTPEVILSFEVFSMHDLKITKIPSPTKILIFNWVEEGENGSRFIQRAVSSKQQYEDVIKEFTDKLSSVYLPSVC